MAKDDRHLHFRSMDVRLKDPYYLGTEQEKTKDRLQEVENSNTQLTQSNAELTKSNGELMKSNAELSRLIAELTQKVDLLTMEKEKETAKFKEDHEQMHLQIQNLFSTVRRLESDLNILCSQEQSQSPSIQSPSELHSEKDITSPPIKDAESTSLPSPAPARVFPERA